MPKFDLSLEELQAYTGSNPRPSDFDAYWDRALKELRGTDSRVELAPADFQVPFAECFDLYYSGVGGARIHAQYLRPKKVTVPHPAVLLFHGYTMNAGDWQDKLGYAALGFSVAAMDCRGQGGKSQDPGGVSGNTQRGHIIRGLDDGPEKLLYRRIFLDAAQLAGIVMDLEDVDPERVGAYGRSQGGALCLACAALEPRIRRIAPCYPFLCDYRRVWELDLDSEPYQELKTYFRLFDPTHEREQETFTRLGYIDVQFLAPRIRARVLMAVGLNDEICPPSSQFAVYNKIASPKQMVLYPDFGHETLPGFPDRAFQFLAGL